MDFRFTIRDLLWFVLGSFWRVSRWAGTWIDGNLSNCLDKTERQLLIRDVVH